ncbi:hypothetical protein [Brevibacterium aurantiacum]|uniref:hypothetical protein n=1 Tax=Brevibacterium aurantiacum TaxID=273384 RepID=UPI000F64B412|nr:hypothetical protein [Brevibacterium aurantiacum]
MNSLPGNDHAAISKFRTEGLHEWQAEEGATDATCIAVAIDANTEATLALGFEQRTANLIALAEFYGNDGHREHGLPILKEINTRLGLNGDTK